MFFIFVNVLFGDAGSLVDVLKDNWSVRMTVFDTVLVFFVGS